MKSVIWLDLIIKLTRDNIKNVLLEPTVEQPSITQRVRSLGNSTIIVPS